jgi:hypothetical protein
VAAACRAAPTPGTSAVTGRFCDCQCERCALLCGASWALVTVIRLFTTAVSLASLAIGADQWHSQVSSATQSEAP